MYVPAHFSFTDRTEVVAFMRRFNFAVIVSQVDGQPFATHLPFVVEEREDGSVRLLAHFARANPQWKDLESQTALVIFSEPHAYVSPSLYEKELNVPTWNYVAVHAYGRPVLIPEEAEARGLLEKQIQTFEKEYFTQWSNLPEEYKNGMLKGIAAFRMEVTRLEGKEKLSQNKKMPEREKIAAHLSENTDSVVRETGAMMKKHLTGKSLPDHG